MASTGTCWGPSSGGRGPLKSVCDLRVTRRTRRSTIMVRWGRPTPQRQILPRPPAKKASFRDGVSYTSKAENLPLFTKL